MAELTHIDEKGRARMVDVSGKQVTDRSATAKARIRMNPETLKRIKEGGIAKGDVLAVAQTAGIMAAKRTWELIPMCHPLAISSVKMDFVFLGEDLLEAEATVKVADRTGVEMEALTAVSVAALTVYDMCKAIDKAMVIEDIALYRKEGGKSGLYQREQ